MPKPPRRWHCACGFGIRTAYVGRDRSRPVKPVSCTMLKRLLFVDQFPRPEVSPSSRHRKCLPALPNYRIRHRGRRLAAGSAWRRMGVFRLFGRLFLAFAKMPSISRIASKTASTSFDTSRSSLSNATLLLFTFAGRLIFRPGLSADIVRKQGRASVGWTAVTISIAPAFCHLANGRPHARASRSAPCDTSLPKLRQIHASVEDVSACLIHPSAEGRKPD
jgi:hypothetical protein